MNTGGFASNMELLDWMAGQALVGLLASPNILSALIDECETDDTPKPIAIKAYEMASAMLAEKARREAVVKESSTTDHSPDAGKMAELQEANKELVEAFGRFLEYVTRVNGVAVFQEPLFAEMRAILAKHKGAA